MLRDADFTLMLSTLDKHEAEILSDANFTLMLSTLDNHVEMLSDADFTLMLSTLNNHDVQTFNDADFTLMLSTLVHSWASMAATLLLSKHRMFHGDSSSSSWFI